MAGVDDGEVPPVPIPNTEVKLTCAEDSWLETACENTKRLGALPGNAALLAQRHHLRTLPERYCLLRRHDVGRQADSTSECCG